MHRLFKRNQILTIPNFLSLVRLALIPVIVWLYCEKNAPGWAVAVIVLSCVTDMADGFIARRYNMISDFGKILDPIADKLTQAAIIFCLIAKFSLMKVLILILIVKEVLMGIMGLIVIKKKDSVNSSQWHGKLTTAMIYAVTALLILFPKIPMTAANVLILLCIGMIVLSFVLYMSFYYKFLSKKAGNRT